MGGGFVTMQLSKKELAEISEVLKLCEKGIIAIKLKTVKAGSYNAVLPLDDLEVQKGKEIVIAQLIPGKVYLMKIE